ncbi:MAG: DUF5615 family PIN-like protein [Blastocatellia bacterium]
MLRLLLDENFHHDILRGLRRQLPEADLLTVQEAGLQGASDPALLAWAAEKQRILVTHDIRTIPKHSFDRLAAGEYLAGVFALPDTVSIGEAIEHLVLLITCSEAAEWENHVTFIPLS